MVIDKEKFYGRGTTKLFQVHLRPEEFDEIIEFVKAQGITRRNYVLRYFGFFKSAVEREKTKKLMANKRALLKHYKALKGRG